MRSVVSNPSSKGEGSLSQDTTKSHVGMVEASLLARLEEGKAPLDRISIYLLGLNARGYNALQGVGINTVQQLIECTESYLLRRRNIGVTTLDDIRYKLNSYIDTMLRTGGWDSQFTQTSADTENIASSPLKQGRTLSTLDEAFTKLLGRLTPREGVILRLRYGIDDGTPRSLEEVGQ